MALGIGLWCSPAAGIEPPRIALDAERGQPLRQRLLAVPSPPSSRDQWLRLLPASLAIPDLYAVDVGEREPPRFAAPLDETGYGAINVLPAPLRRGRALSLGYLTETPPLAGDSRWRLRLSFEVRF